MSKLLDTVLKVLGVIVALLVILSIIVLLGRSMQPATQHNIPEQQYIEPSFWYSPYWDWLSYPYYWFYPYERTRYPRRHYNKPHHTPSTTLAPTEPVEVPTEPVEVPTEPVEVPTEPVEVPTEPVEVPTEPVDLPIEPVFLDINPNITFSNSLIDGLIPPVNTPPQIEEPIQIESPPQIEGPVSNPVGEINSVNMGESVVETFQNPVHVPEPWSTITSLPGLVL